MNSHILPFFLIIILCCIPYINKIPSFTDFSSADDMARQDLAFSKQLEAELLADGPLDFEIQMLSDPTVNMIPENVEDHFRLDHRS